MLSMHQQSLEKIFSAMENRTPSDRHLLATVSATDLPAPGPPPASIVERIVAFRDYRTSLHGFFGRANPASQSLFADLVNIADQAYHMCVTQSTHTIQEVADHLVRWDVAALQLAARDMQFITVIAQDLYDKIDAVAPIIHAATASDVNKAIYAL